MADLTVSDEDYSEYTSAIKALADTTEEKIHSYLTVMRNTRETAIISGIVGLRLDGFILSTESLLRETVRIQSLATGLCVDHYLQDIDDADQMIY
jgi:hypothetical protein